MPTQPHPGAGMQGTFYFIQEDYRMVDYLRVGVITSPHGLRGDVKVFPTTDDVNRFKKLKTVWKRKNAGDRGTGAFFQKYGHS